MTIAEKKAYEAGLTAYARIGDRAMCYDTIMEDLVVGARSQRGHDYNAKIMAAWAAGRAENDPEWWCKVSKSFSENPHIAKYTQLM